MPRSKVLFIFEALLVVFSPLGCRLKEEKHQDFGLTLVELAIDGENLAKLNGNVWAKVPVAAQVKIGGQTLTANVNYYGKSTIDAYKKSYELSFAGKDRYQGRQSYRLSAQATDKSGVRAMVGFPMFASQGLLTPAHAPAVLYVNGAFAGLYLLLEPIDEEFLSVRGIKTGNLVKSLYANTDFDEETAAAPERAFNPKSDPDFLGDVRRLAETVQKESTPATKAELDRLLDIEATLRYMTVAVALNHWDGFSNNIFFYRAAGSPRFAIVPWDLDRLYDETSPQSAYVPGKSLYGTGGLAAKLTSFPELRERYRFLLKTLITETMPLPKLHQAIDLAKARIALAFGEDRVLAAKGTTIEVETAVLKDAATRRYAAIERDLAQP